MSKTKQKDEISRGEKAAILRFDQLDSNPVETVPRKDKASSSEEGEEPHSNRTSTQQHQSHCSVDRTLATLLCLQVLVGGHAAC